MKLETCSYFVKRTKTTEIHHILLWIERGLKLYQLPQEEVDRIERMFKGGNDSDIESDDESVGNDTASEGESDDDHPRRVSCNTRSGRAATRSSLI